MRRYNPKDIEPKWQQQWAASKTYQAVDFDESRPKYTMLTEFPYPSGDGLHLGHVREYTLGDIIARHKRMNGYNVLFPMGYDAFGLPTENYAIKNGIAPQVATDRNTSNFQKQFESLGFSIDWSRAFRTTDPDYYKWTQWLFLQFYKAGLAYQDKIAINWCPKCKTGLANEEVSNGRHERCGTLVEKRELKQWLLKITAYADRLIAGLADVDYPSRIADQQINWIGRSKGAEIDFELETSDKKLKVFTTRPDTLFGATFMVVAPEHPIVTDITTEEQKAAVETYVKESQAKSDIQRQETDREKTGVFTGAHVINPINNEKIPIWIADYVLWGYGTGAIMAVPAHDERDHAFAKKFKLPIRQVIAERFIHTDNKHREDVPVVPRTVVCMVVKHPSEDKILIARPKKSDFWSPVMGGIDSGETAEQAAKRELLEESGYHDIKRIEVFDEVMCSEFYAQHKGENRIAYVNTALVELNSLDAKEVSAAEKAAVELRWATPKEVDELCVGAGAGGIYQIARGEQRPMVHEGRMINSGKYDGQPSAEARETIVADLQKAGKAQERVNYKLRDWIFSRQHYWGEPIPIIHCPDHGAVAVPDSQLPVTLPGVEQYEPTDTGESPLAAIAEWVNTTCPTCGGSAKRETDTMPNWAGSSWYYLRFFDAHNDKQFADPEKLKYWGEVDMYLGGMEHTTLHLLYSRFWHQFFYDQGLVPTPEPYRSRRGQGIILAADGSKMSKSKGNIINPNSILDRGYGADSLRLSIAFLAPYDQTTPWSSEGVAGTFRFVQRIWTLVHEFKTSQESNQESNRGPDKPAANKDLQRAMHYAIKRVDADLQQMSFNTAVAALMEYVNQLYKLKQQDAYAHKQDWQAALDALVQLVAPYAPHVAEELWQTLGHDSSVHVSQWPKHDEQYLVSNTMQIVVQVNGKLRSQIEMPADASETEVLEAAQADQKIVTFLAGKPVKKRIYVPGRIVNLVV